MRGWLMLAGAAAVATGAGVAGVAALGEGDEPPADPADEAADGSTTVVEVVRRDLARVEDLDGSVGHGDSTPLVLAADGTLTALPDVGQVLQAGDVVAEVDGVPIIALQGPYPLWRALGPGVEDGKDVLQLEYILASLGYAQEHDVTVDDDWTSATTDAVEAFQEDHGMDDDGEIGIGEVVFIEGPVQVADVTGVVGQQASEAGISVTSPEQSVHVDLDAADADLLAVGDVVEVELPTGTTTSGTVATIGAAETDETTGEATLPVTLTLSDAPPLADGTPVDVHVEIAAAQGVLAVPVEAVLALAEGGYAVEVAEGEGATATTRLVGVTLGVFADGMVEITGDIAEGDQVVVPE
jgi:peptidoglycan hydrolase-like protein with peptidoglycan-binding domain